MTLFFSNDYTVIKDLLKKSSLSPLVWDVFFVLLLKCIWVYFWLFCLFLICLFLPYYHKAYHNFIIFTFKRYVRINLSSLLFNFKSISCYSWFLIVKIFCSVTKSCPAVCHPMDCSTAGFLVLHYLPEFAQTHWVDDVSQPSHSLSSPSPPAFNLSQHRGLFQWVSSSSH